MYLLSDIFKLFASLFSWLLVSKGIWKYDLIVSRDVSKSKKRFSNAGLTRLRCLCGFALVALQAKGEKGTHRKHIHIAPWLAGEWALSCTKQGLRC